MERTKGISTYSKDSRSRITNETIPVFAGLDNWIEALERFNLMSMLNKLLLERSDDILSGIVIVEDRRVRVHSQFLLQDPEKKLGDFEESRHGF